MARRYQRDPSTTDPSTTDTSANERRAHDATANDSRASDTTGTSSRTSDTRAVRDEDAHVADVRGPNSRAAARGLAGHDAEKPSQIPAKGWLQIVKRAWREGKADNVSMLAAGVAFFAFLAIFPAMVAALSVYGLVADPTTVTSQVDSFASALPSGAKGVITDQLTAIAGGNHRGLSISLVVAILLALWSASGGTGNLMKAVNIAYDEDEKRGFLKRRLIAIGLTLGGIVFVLLAVALVAVVPVLLGSLGLGPVAQIAAQVVRWLLLVVLVVVALAVVYRIAPDRDDARVRWVSLGAGLATVVWVIASVGFSLYVNFFGNYQKTYGALAGVIVFLLWLYLTCYVVLLGAEVNAEAEKQTVKDTTTGPPRPMGDRDAVAADTLPDDPDGSSRRS